MSEPRPDAKEILMAGWHGAPQLKQQERRQFLGEFAERVLAAVTKQEAEAAGLNRQIAAAVRDRQARAVIAHTDIPFQHRLKYSQLAKEAGLTFTVRSDPSYIGDIGLIVVSDEAVATET